MGTRLDMVLVGVEEHAGQKAFESVQQLISGLENELSRYDENSTLSIVNRLGFKRPVRVGADLYGLLDRCRNYHTDTLGIFDVGLGKVTLKIRQNKPDPEEVLEMMKASGMGQIELEPEEMTVRFHSPGVEIDLGGIGKGYALDRARHVLDSLEIRDAFVSFGGSSVLAIGSHPYGECWKSGINHFFDQGNNLFTFELREESLSTSGMVPGNSKPELPGHILHPQKGMLYPGFRHISTVRSRAEEAEVLSTSLMAASSDERMDILRNFPDTRAVEVRYDQGGEAEIINLTPVV